MPDGAPLRDEWYDDDDTTAGDAVLGRGGGGVGPRKGCADEEDEDAKG